MQNHILLRFSDAEGLSTVAEHQRIIANEGSTWWGWWKKEWEPFPSELLKSLKLDLKNRDVQIGLFNRKDSDKFYVATCSGIEFDESSNDLAAVDVPTPSHSHTPEYYRDQPFPAWFRFKSIEELKRMDFLDRFHIKRVPALDPTLYEVRITGTEHVVFPKDTWTMASTELDSDIILHLSDLHFGEDHGFPLTSKSAATGVHALTLCEKILRGLQNLNCNVGLVVVSGDLTTKGKADAYPAAVEFLDQLLLGLGLSRRHCVIVPGNHDLFVEHEEHPTRTYAHEEPYRLFWRGFFGTSSHTLERVRRFTNPSGQEFIFIELNSARIRSDELKEYGFVSKHRYDELFRFVKRGLRQDSTVTPPLIFVVLHHHILPVNQVEIPVKQHPVSLCLDSGQLIDEFQNNGVHVVLHGHQHTPFVGSTTRILSFPGNRERADADRTPLHVIGCGSSGVRRDRIPPEVGMNYLGLYRPIGNELEVRFGEYDERTDLKITWETKINLGSIPASSKPDSPQLEN